MAESREGVCKHGGLRRQCETCDLAEEVDSLAAERDRLLKVAEAAQTVMDNQAEYVRLNNLGDPFANQDMQDLRCVLLAYLKERKP
jgi:hypothetical protein